MQKVHIPSGLKGNTYINSDSYQELYEKSIKYPEIFWAEKANEMLDWYQTWDKVLQYDYQKAEIAWFLNAKINVCYNCVDRHAENTPDKTAIIWEGNEPGETRKISYSELKNEVSKIANVLKKFGIKKGDRVALYMPMVSELAYSMLACARIGAVHTIIFAGFSAEAIKGRLLDSEVKLVITANQALRGNKKIELKEIVDNSLEGVHCVKTVLVHKRTPAKCSMTSGRDYFLADESASQSEVCQPEIMDSEICSLFYTHPALPESLRCPAYTSRISFICITYS